LLAAVWRWRYPLQSEECPSGGQDIITRATYPGYSVDFSITRWPGAISGIPRIYIIQFNVLLRHYYISKILVPVLNAWDSVQWYIHRLQAFHKAIGSLIKSW